MLFMVSCIYIIYTMKQIILPDVILFEWDEGNNNKNWVKHQVTERESEEAFYDKKRIIFEDVKHSKREERYILFGKTKEGKKLFIAFTMRGEYKEKIRIISARTLKRKEAKMYEKTVSAA
jgi:uncharacterized protein